MAEKIEAIVKPEMLIWARESAGFDLQIAAKKIQVKADRLQSWELGESRPTVNQEFGFEPDLEHFTVSGVCSECQSKHPEA